MVVAVNDNDVQKLDLSQVEKCHKLSDILHSPDPVGLAKFLIDPNAAPIPIDEVRFQAPVAFWIFTHNCVSSRNQK